MIERCHVHGRLLYSVLLYFVVKNLISPLRDTVLSCLSTETIMSDLKDAKEWVECI